ncbi:hypothetical protein [Plantactinospora sp. GCM10030261]|uniref:hypothetical protein n=1 Tax=Plantactinospora sp. GCM10030261 TaxID=3273420 RepID=UPI003622091F
MSFVVPDACTLPTADQPLRGAEFENLFARAVRSVDRIDARHVRIRLAGEPRLDATVRDLVARESRCCGFFGFTVAADRASAGGEADRASAGGEADRASAGRAARTPEDQAVTLDIEVPETYVDVLDGLARLAETRLATRLAETRAT